jgi:hypothetical protein
MKNLKKLSRKELKNLKGFGSMLDEAYSDDVAGGGGSYKCCTDLSTCSSCSPFSNCPSGQFLKAC